MNNRSRNRATWIFIVAYAIIIGITFFDPTISVMPGIAALCVLLFGIYTYFFQLELVRFNRFSHRPSLIVNKSSLENDRVIQIENTDKRIAYDISIASILFSDDGINNMLLFQENHGFLAQEYPIVQSDILKSDFRLACEAEDKITHGNPLSIRLEQFINKHKGKPLLLVVAIQSPFHDSEDITLFIYRSEPIEKMEDAKWQSIHFNRNTIVYRNALSAAIKANS